MVGDDLEADVIGAMAAGLRCCLCRTGQIQQLTACGLPPQASPGSPVSAELTGQVRLVNAGT